MTDDIHGGVTSHVTVGGHSEHKATHHVHIEMEDVHNEDQYNNIVNDLEEVLSKYGSFTEKVE